MGTLGLVAYIAFFFGLMYFLMIRPQNKKNKQLQELRSSLKQGDDVVTIGGIAGKILNVKEDDVVLEIGAAKTKLTFKKWAISTVEHSVPTAEIEETTFTEE
ncbi:preprotein translocase subunit YajC [Fusibacter sp. 3D3]|uniref:preprotein translocase subunit YajC n=1 Tax=Fusibacter sp. 3D3 TaxID=1048380 RepID=UPI0008538360|nr:preprotein translocase subunit YajC [Fusibacter sp. 3D3]GAU78568.1 preprotein translocase subunit YajC [Fusibacter sp. 3D3]